MSEFAHNPEYNELETALASTLLDEANQAGDIYTYYNSLLQLYIEHPFIGDQLQKLAYYVEPADREYGYDSDIASAQAFYMGVVIGARAVEVQGGEVLLNTLERASLPMAVMDGDTDIAHRLHLQACSILDKGAELYEQGTAFHEILEQWESLLVHDATKHSYFRKGFGIIRHLTKGAELILEDEKLSAELGDYDWDQALKSLANDYRE